MFLKSISSFTNEPKNPEKIYLLLEYYCSSVGRAEI